MKKLLTLILIFLIAGAPMASAATVEQKRNQVNSQIQRLKRLESQEKNKLIRNQRKLDDTSKNLEVSRSRYNSLQGQLAGVEREYEVVYAQYNQIHSQVQNRLRRVFKNQRVGMFQLILTAGDLNALLDVIYFQKIVIKQDTDRMMRFKTQSQNIAKMKKDIESRRVTLAQTMNEMNSQQKSITKSIAQNQNMIKKLNNDRAYYEKTERELARQSSSIETMISKNKGAVTVASTGAFGAPIAGRISSPFGWRTHPIFNSRTFHSGVDIAGPNMGALRASNAGKVIFAGWYGGYGKVVIVDHGVVGGSPITTLYAHMNSIKVSEGQNVNKGDILGYEGSTGYSTGPHCHFEVRVNGKPNNPMNYI